MIRALIFLALWAALPPPDEVGSTALYTEFQHEASPAIVRAMRQEVDSLMAPDGLHFEWRSLPVTDNHVWTELAVVRFKGRCEVLPFATNSNSDGRLGWTHISDGVVLPFADVDCDAIRAYIQDHLFLLPPESRETLYGRAIGRVLAHELLHVFAKTAHHSSEGVDRPSLSREELLADHPEFADRENGLHILRMSRIPVKQPALGSPQAGRASYFRDGCSSCHGAQAEGTRHGPVLRIAGRILSSVILAAKLTKSQKKMAQRARSLKVAAPSLAEEELGDLASFLNDIH